MTDVLKRRLRYSQVATISLHIPYGYRLGDDDVMLVTDDAEQMVIRAARRYSDAGLSLRAISKRLADDGYRNRHGRVFSASSVRNILKDAA